MRKVFLEDLPRKGKLIDWKKSAGYKVKFIYDNIEGYIEIINYNKNHGNLTVKHNDKINKSINTGNFINCKLGGILGKVTKNFRIEVGTTFKDDKRDITIIDRHYIKHKGYNGCKFYKYRCNKCGFKCDKFYSTKQECYKNELYISEYNLLDGIGCACCRDNPQIVVEGINDIPTTAPWMVKFFQGGYDEAKKYTCNSGRKIYPICPDCGNIRDKLVKIYHIYSNHSIGCVCGDGKKYPEKFMYSVLKQLNIEFKTQYSPKWAGKKAYDFYFKLNNKEYIIEMDGSFHYVNNSMNGQTKEKSQRKDEIKNKLAEEHDIKVIRINCNYENDNKMEYIKYNILKSELNDIFNFKNINWIQCDKFSISSNLKKQVCDYWDSRKESETTKDLANRFSLGRNTIISYLKDGTKYKWCNYNPKEEAIKSSSKIGKSKGKPVEIFKDGISLGIFPSYTELERQSEELFGVKLNNSNISSACNKKSQYKGYVFKLARYQYRKSNFVTA